jgi:hypothetical protein
MSKDGIASGFAFGFDPTGRSDYFRLIKIDRIPYFDIRHLSCSSFFSDQIGYFLAGGGARLKHGYAYAL